MAEKKYYWLKLKEDFFRQPRMKKLRKVAGGDTYTIIYLKMQLLSLENEGMLFFEGIEDDFIEELALTIDEDPDNVRFTVLFLIDQGLMEEVRKDEYALPEAIKAIGSEGAAAERKRRSRENQKMLQENRDNVTDMSQDGHGEVTNCHTELELEKELYKERELYNNNGNDDSDLSTNSDNLSTRPVISAQWVKDVIRDKWNREATENDITQAVTQLAKLNYQGEMLANALDLAAQHGSRAKNWNYVVTIIDNWINKGYKTEEDVLMHELNRKGGAR